MREWKRRKRDIQKEEKERKIGRERKNRERKRGKRDKKEKQREKEGKEQRERKKQKEWDREGRSVEKSWRKFWTHDFEKFSVWHFLFFSYSLLLLFLFLSFLLVRRLLCKVESNLANVAGIFNARNKNCAFAESLLKNVTSIISLKTSI